MKTPSIIDLDERPDPADRALPPRRGRHRKPEPPAQPWASRPRLIAVIAVAVAVVASGIALLIPDAEARQPDGAASQESGAQRGKPGGSAGEATSVTLRTPKDGSIVTDFSGFLSWALIDDQGELTGSKNLKETVWPGSIIKVWIVADFLRSHDEKGTSPDPDSLALARKAIRDSDDRAANALYKDAGGRAQLRRMISMCELTDTSIEGKRWRDVLMSARDAARLGRCIVDGRAAGPNWTGWVRTEMAKVRGTAAEQDQPYGGRWGIIDGLPTQLQDTVGIKNGWIVVESDDEWHVNCLAVADEWSLAVLTRYPADRGLQYGAEACATVASQLVSPADS